MTKSFDRFKALAWLSLTVAGLLAVSVIILSGCTDTLKGDENANKAPVVYFVNIPPDSSSFSHNPEVYWFGSDVDGQIDYYRYVVATSTEIGGANLADFAAGLHDTMWTYVDVDPTESDPQTAHVIPLTADLDDPVNNFVEQFIFLQAYDDDGAGSQFAYKCLNRNDNPPTTLLYSVTADTPFVNAVNPGGIVTGVWITWAGEDKQDYDEQGLIPPPFEFEWKLFGPFTDDSMAWIRETFREKVFVTPGGKIYHAGDTLFTCDLVMIEGEDSTYWEEQCDTHVFDTSDVGSADYRIDSLLHLDCVNVMVIDEEDDTSYVEECFPSDQVAAYSWNGIDTWVYDTRDTLYNVFANYGAGDSTISRNFIFWVRCRDDAMVPDPTPIFRDFPVINPKFERDILVIDLQYEEATYRGCLLSYIPNMDYPDMIDTGLTRRRTFWKNAIAQWDSSIVFDPEGKYNDYVHQSDYLDGLPLRKLLKYKLLVILEDNAVVKAQGLNNTEFKHDNVFVGIDVGINAWIAGRSFLDADKNASNAYAMIDATQNYRRYFGVEAVYFTQWLTFRKNTHPFYIDPSIPAPLDGVRMEDFVGAYSIDQSRWPELDVDTATLHKRYFFDSMDFIPTEWKQYTPWRPEIAALPEVGWCMRTYGTEVMYLYKSKYGPNHFLGYPFIMDGAPVAHRYETNYFRTSWFMFTPYAFKDSVAYDLVGKQLDYLYDPTLGSSDTPLAKRYPNAEVKISLDEARVNASLRKDSY